MKQIITTLALATLFAGPAWACKYEPGTTPYVDYARCMYGADEVQVVDLPGDSKWDQCVYRVQAFMPPKLLAITRDTDGQEQAVTNVRGSIGNPCYLMKKACDAAFQAQQG